MLRKSLAANKVVSNGSSEQMYKKRIRAWGLTKNTKAEKDVVISDLISGSSAVANSHSVHRDRLVRYAKSQAKASKLDNRCLNRITELSKHFSNGQPCLAASSTTPAWPSGSGNMSKLTTPLQSSLALPDAFADTDLLLRATKEVMLNQCKTKNDSCVQIEKALRDGMRYWDSHAFASARDKFANAAQRIVTELQTRGG